MEKYLKLNRYTRNWVAKCLLSKMLIKRRNAAGQRDAWKWVEVWKGSIGRMCKQNKECVKRQNGSPQSSSKTDQ